MTLEEVLAAMEAGTITDERAALDIAALIMQDSRNKLNVTQAYAQAQQIVTAERRSLASRVQSLGTNEFRGEAVSPFGETGFGQRQAFDAFLGNQFPGGLPRVAGQALQGQFEGVQPFFEPFRLLGQIPTDQPFPQFLQNNLGAGGFDPRTAVSNIAGIFDIDPAVRTTGERSLVRNLVDDPGQQTNMIFQALRQGFPLSALNTLRSVLAQAAGQFATSQPTDPTTGLPGVNARQLIQEFDRGGLFPRG